jgi:thiamine biosynthesis protein ThiS
VRITLNGDQFEIPGRLSVTALLGLLDVDPRRVAVEHNHAVVRRAAFDVTIVDEGDSVEMVNFVGGGCNE